MNDNRFDPNNPPDIVNRFLVACEAIKAKDSNPEAHGKSMHYIDSNSTICCIETSGSLTAHIKLSNHLKTIGQLRTDALGGNLFEISPGLLSSLEQKLKIERPQQESEMTH